MNILKEEDLAELEQENFHDEFQFLLRFYELTYPEFSTDLNASQDRPMKVGISLYTRLWMKYENIRYILGHASWDLGFNTIGPLLDNSLSPFGYEIQ